MEKLKLEIIGMSYSQSQSGAYALILGVVGEKKRLPIIIGGFEAQAIAIELENMKPARPLTHDLFKQLATEFNIKITEVVINKFENGIFYSLLVCEKNGETIFIDSRTSDAVALALRFGCPIYANKVVVDEAGIEMDDEAIEQETSDDIEDETMDNTVTEEVDLPIKQFEEPDFDVLTTKELEYELQKAIDEENYEFASKIRDELKKRHKKKK